MNLQAADSDFALHARTNSDGEFELPEAPIGVYRLTVTAAGFADTTETLTVASGTNPVLHIPLDVAGTTQSVIVNGEESSADTVTPTNLITRQTIEETPGADRTIGTEMITVTVSAPSSTSRTRCFPGSWSASRRRWPTADRCCAATATSSGWIPPGR